MKFITIGGGSIGRHGSEPNLIEIDKEIIRLSGKADPKILLLPTANTCPEAYFRVFKRYYKSLGGEPYVLYLKKDTSAAEIEEKIRAADAIYVGGGNTLKMMNTWKRFGVDKLLIEKSRSGAVMSGLSAGAICWYNFGNSDSVKYRSGKEIMIKVSGLGLINAAVCPHFDTDPAEAPNFERQMKTIYNQVGICLDDCSAIEIVDDEYRVITSKATANAYRAFWKKGKYILEKIDKTKEFRPLSELLTKVR